jgi:hypothetical protein
MAKLYPYEPFGELSGMIAPLFDTCVKCGRPSSQPGAGICLQCEIMALIDLSFDRIRAALRGEIPVIGRRILSGTTASNVGGDNQKV